ncbi:hypothetical protein EPI10_000729 [Gossypium australe]|uniref:Uncharacterized protein n=1 Tax=Gossypium australe TaxID=47621 RepID=A0A5B6V8V1_9ROSI|nr:hypothetical protein EPI10_000729 [Gossypium australe]
MRAITVLDEPVATIAPVLARWRGHDKGDGGKGTGKRGAARFGDGGLARVYTVREPQIREATDVIAANFGATRLFILIDVASELGIAVETSRSSVTMKSPLGDSVVVGRAYRHCPSDCSWTSVLD